MYASPSLPKRLPHRSEGRACHARRSAMNNLKLRIGPDKQVPPKVGRSRLLCPLKRNGSSNIVHRARQARPSERRTRRGTPVVPAEVGWIIKRYFADLTSRSLRRTRLAPSHYVLLGTARRSDQFSPLASLKSRRTHKWQRNSYLFADSGFNPFKIERNFLSELSGFFPG